jgi:hypothetical protein
MRRELSVFAWLKDLQPFFYDKLLNPDIFGLLRFTACLQARPVGCKNAGFRF